MYSKSQKRVPSTSHPSVVRLVCPEGLFNLEEEEFVGLFTEIPPKLSSGNDNSEPELSDRSVYHQVGGRAKIFYSHSKRQWIVGMNTNSEEGWIFSDSDATSPDQIESGWTFWDCECNTWTTEDTLCVVPAGETGLAPRYEVFDGRASPCIDSQLSVNYSRKEGFSESSTEPNSPQSSKKSFSEETVCHEEKTTSTCQGTKNSAMRHRTEVQRGSISKRKHTSNSKKSKAPEVVTKQSRLKPLKLPAAIRGGMKMLSLDANKHSEAKNLKITPPSPKSPQSWSPNPKTPKRLRRRARTGQRQIPVACTSPLHVPSNTPPGIAENFEMRPALTRNEKHAKKDIQMKINCDVKRKQPPRKNRRSVSPTPKKKRRAVVKQCANCFVRRHDHFTCCRKCTAYLCTKCYGHHYCGRKAYHQDLPEDQRETRRSVVLELS